MSQPAKTAALPLNGIQTLVQLKMRIPTFAKVETSEREENSGSNTIKGGGGNDFIVGGAGSDALYGGADADIFRYGAAGFGNDVIVDFQDGLDHLSFSTTIASSFAAFTITGNGTNNVSVSIGGETLAVQGAAPITLTAADFFFN